MRQGARRRRLPRGGASRGWREAARSASAADAEAHKAVLHRDAARGLEAGAKDRGVGQRQLGESEEAQPFAQAPKVACRERQLAAEHPHRLE